MSIPVYKLCVVAGCSKPAVAKGLCDTHRKRRDRHGHVFGTRPPQWGQKDKHPLIHAWRHLVRCGNACREWSEDFWLFVSEVGDRPSPDHVLSRVDESVPANKNNVFWKEWKNESRVHNTEYMRAWRNNNPEYVLRRNLKRHYGLTLELYLEMHDAQGGTCAICGQPETSVDPKTKKTRRLAVDHCHSTNKVRGLLCSKCNTALGQVGDNQHTLLCMIEYLKLHA